jgi:hypothetical protein
MVEFGYVQELITDSIQSAVQRAEAIVECLAAEVSKDKLYSGMSGLRLLGVDHLSVGLKNLFKKSEEFLFLVSETRLRVSNSMAWLYKEAKKYEQKKEDTQEVPEMTPDEIFLKNHPIDKSLLLRFLKTEDSFMIRYMSAYLKSAVLPRSELNQMEFDFFNRPEVASHRISTENRVTQETVRDQATKYSFDLIDAFSKQLTGTSFKCEQVSCPMHIESIDDNSNSIRMLVKRLSDDVDKCCKSIDKCLTDTVSCVKCV